MRVPTIYVPEGYPELTIDQAVALKVVYNRPGEEEPTIACPVWQGFSVVWATAVIPPVTPLYRLYDLGTNCLIALRCQNGQWSAIDVTEIENIYGMLWILTTTLQRVGYNASVDHYDLTTRTE